MTLTTTGHSAPDPTSQTDSGPIGRVVLVFLLTGILGALALALVAFPGGQEHLIIGSTLIAFGAGWGLLAWLSTRVTALPQRWARVPAAVMTATGVAVLTLAPGDAVLSAAGWVWPVALGGLAVWMAVRIRRSLPGRAAWLLYPIVGLLVAAAVGGLSTTVAARATADRYPMPGRAYAVNGHQLHLDCQGTGSPTVVLENGLGLSSPAWANITEAVSTTTRVCAYDRAGQGWSEDPAGPQDSRAVASDLHALLSAAGERGPIVLAGHSAGGVYAMTYAATYPDDVAGLVLLDSMSPDQFALVPAYPVQYEMIRRAYGVLGPLTRIGLGPVLADAPSELPAPAAEPLRAIQLRARTYDNARDEVSLFHRSLEQAQALTTLDAKPLVVVTSAELIETSPGWAGAQDELTRLSTNSSHRIAGTSHAGVVMSTAGSEISARAITDVVHAARTGGAVPQP